MDTGNVDRLTLDRLIQELIKIRSNLNADDYRNIFNGFTKLHGGGDIGELLAAILVKSEIDAAVRDLALNFLETLPVEDIQRGVSEVWLNTRDAQLAELIKNRRLVSDSSIRTRAYTILQSEAYDQWGPYLGTWLVQEVLKIANAKEETELAPKAVDWLKYFTTQYPAIAESAWMETKSVILLKILEELNCNPGYPPIRFWLAFHLNSRDEVITEGNRQIIELLLASCLDKNPKITERGLQLLEKITDKSVQEEVCRQIMQRNHSSAQKVAVEQGWLPLELPERALFFLLTEQWAKYDRLDFDQRLVQGIYQNADKELRRKIAEVVRISGRSDYLRILTGGTGNSREKELTDEEATIVIDTLSREAAWEQLWQLVPTLPLAQSMAVVKQLEHAGWQATTPDAQEKRAELAELVAGLEGVNFAETANQYQILPPLFQRTKTRLILPNQRAKTKQDGEKIKGIAFSAKRPLLALAITGNRVVLWNTQTSTIEQVIQSKPRKSVAFVAFTESDILCWAERSSVDIECSIYCWLDGAVEEVGQHAAPVTQLLPYLGDQLISGGQDGSTVLWDVRQKALLARHTIYNAPYDHPRGLALSHDKKYLAILHTSLIILALPDFEEVGGASYTGYDTLQKGVFTPDNAGLVLVKRHTQTRYATNPATQQFASVLTELTDYAKQGKAYLPGVVAIPELDLVLAATEDGQLDFMDWSRQKSSRYFADLGNTERTTRLTRIYASLIQTNPANSFLAIADTAGQIHIYDMRLLILQQLFTRPLAAIAEKHFTAIKLLREEYAELCRPELIAILRYIEAVISFRLRYEIEVDEVPIIRPGEFDIEVE